MNESRSSSSSLELVPLLGLQHRLYDMPPGRERFDRYVRAMTGGGEDLEPPEARLTAIEGRAGARARTGSRDGPG